MVHLGSDDTGFDPAAYGERIADVYDEWLSVPAGQAEVAAAVFLQREDRLAAGADVAAQREHRDLRVDARVHHVRLIGSHRQFVGAGVTPAGGGRPATAALQRQDQVEHGRQYAGLR